MANTVTASLVVQFGAADVDSDGHLSVEIDNRDVSDGGLNASTSFVPGDTAYLLMYRSSNVQIDEVVSSAGSLVDNRQKVILNRTEYLTFAKTNEASLQKPAITGSISAKWLGNDLGTIQVTEQLNVRSADVGVGVLKVEYQTEAEVYRLSSPTLLNGETEFTILCFFAGSEIVV